MVMANDLDTLRQRLDEEASLPVDPSVGQVVEAIRRRHGAAVSAVLFYGSCLRGPDPARAAAEGVIDLYVLVDRYRDLYGPGPAALANALLPPNVFYIEVPADAGTRRAKYAVVTLARFRRDTTRAALHPSLWARFCQPTRLLYARDKAVRAAVVAGLADAVVTMLGQTAPLTEGNVTATALWRRAFAETYRTELRVEGSGRAGEIYAWNPARYDRLTGPALRAAGLAPAPTQDGQGFRIAIGAPGRIRARARWAARRWLGKPLTMLRLIKGAFTFDGAADYVLWKIERHSGIRPRVTAWQRRHPILASPLLLWRLYRQGALR
jgi:hypothetical protein